MLAYTHTKYKCVLTLYNSNLLGAATGGRYSYKINDAAIRTSIIHPYLVGPHDFEDACPYTFYLSCRIELIEYFLLVFLSHFCLDIVLVPFWQVRIYHYNKLLLSFDDLNFRWLLVNNYTCNRMFSKHVRKQKFQIFC